MYLAEQSRPIRRKVALKVVKSGMDSKQVLSRFNHERQAVAIMDHPNIARVFDADMTAEGRPFFVMEYVDGVAITQYCDDKRLDTEKRLRLFVKVCSAVQHAHGKGIIHRDIKPSNVMVTEVDGEAVPKVIDFGIAKATDHRGLDGTAFTEFGQFIGTPEYMSPEQADIMTGLVDTGSDVYSLGILLYELLAGAVPFDGVTLRRAGLAEMLRIVREVEAPSMQARLSSLGGTATDVAARRATTLPELRRKLTGDLNWIVTRAVEKQSGRRYASVSDLGADVTRHLNSEAVLASPPGTLYRAGKFIRRHRLPVAAGLAVAVALIAGTAVSVTQAAVANRERNIAVQLRARAEAQSRRAEEQSRHLEQQSQETTRQRVRAEEQAALAGRNETLARQQSRFAEDSLGDVQSLANSMFGELNDEIRSLAGATKARETMTELGLRYLNKVSERSGKLRGSPQLETQLATAYLRVGELAGDPRGANTRDRKLAHDSFERSKTLLKAQLARQPGNSELRHQLIIATLRFGQTEGDNNPERASAFSTARAMAEQLVRDEPRNLQAKADLAETFMDRFICTLWESCASQADPPRAVALRTEILAADPTSVSARWELARAQVEFGLMTIDSGLSSSVPVATQALASLDVLHRDDPSNVLYQRERAIAYLVIGRAPTTRKEPSFRSSIAILEELAAADPLNTSVLLDLTELQIFLASSLYQSGKKNEAESLIKRAVATREQLATRHSDDPDLVFELGKIHWYIARSGAVDASVFHGELLESQAIFRKLAKEYPTRTSYADWAGGALRIEIEAIARGPGASEERITAAEAVLSRYMPPAAQADASARDASLVFTLRQNLPIMIRSQNTVARSSRLPGQDEEGRQTVLARHRAAAAQFVHAETKSGLELEVNLTVSAFRQLEEPQDALPLIDFGLPATVLYPRVTLLRSAADVELDIGDFSASAEYRRELLIFGRNFPGDLAADWLGLASAEQLAGHGPESKQALRQSIELLLRISPRRIYVLSQLGFAAEQLGELSQALQYYKQQLSIPSGTRIVPPQQRNAFGRIARILTMLQGDQADLSAIVPGVTPRAVELARAVGFELRAQDLTQFGLYDQAVIEATRSVELLRPMASADIAGGEGALGSALRTLGHALICQARSRQGAELSSLLRKSLDANRESVALTSDPRARNDIRNAEGKLAALIGQAGLP